MANTGQLPSNTNEDMSLRFDIGDASFTSTVTSDISLEAAHENLGYDIVKFPPIEHTEWYGANTGYLDNDGVNGYVRGSWTRSYDVTQNDWSIVCWLRVTQSTKANAIFWDLGGSTSNSNYRLYLQYNASFNRILVNLRTNAQNFIRAFGLHDNSTQTGISNSGTGWCTAQRGLRNSQNWTMLTVTYDASASTPTAAFKIYWNANELTTQAAAPNQGRSNYTPSFLTLMDLTFGAPTANNADFELDEWKYFEGIISSTTVSNLWNSGVMRNNSNQTSPITLTQTEISFDRHSDQAEDTAGYYSSPTIQTGASRRVHQDATSLNL